eukprot:COSAG01_NODE_153_length_23909_cov_32.542018_27_plen_69_part_00
MRQPSPALAMLYIEKNSVELDAADFSNRRFFFVQNKILRRFFFVQNKKNGPSVPSAGLLGPSGGKVNS